MSITTQPPSHLPSQLKAWLTSIATAVNAWATGVAPGYKVARGTASVTGTADITTGLTTVVSVVAGLGVEPTLTAMWVSAVPGGTAGHITVDVLCPASKSDSTPGASTAPTAVYWIAVGT